MLQRWDYWEGERNQTYADLIEFGPTVPRRRIMLQIFS